MTSCFDSTGGEDPIGWCATCDPKAKRGQRGYCGPGETNREEEAPIIHPNSTNWGFCHKDCLSRPGDEDMLQARVHFIPIRHLRWHFLNYYLRDSSGPKTQKNAFFACFRAYLWTASQPYKLSHTNVLQINQFY